MAPPTVKQHTTVLSGAGMVELIDEGRKWKYYSLTPKGKGILDARHRESSIMLLLSSTVIVALAVFGGLFMQPYFTSQAGANYDADNSIMSAVASQDSKETTAVNSEPKMMAAKSQPRCTPAFSFEYNTNPNAGISTREQAALDCRAAKTEEGCAGIDNLNTDTNSYNSPDGVPDCEWTAEFAAK